MGKKSLRGAGCGVGLPVYHFSQIFKIAEKAADECIHPSIYPLIYPSNVLKLTFFILVTMHMLEIQRCIGQPLPKEAHRPVGRLSFVGTLTS